MTARSTQTWQSTTWARWLGWTALCTLGLGLWGVVCLVALEVAPGPEALGWIVVASNVVGAGALGFAIGMRFAAWSWVFGVVVAHVLITTIWIRLISTAGLPESGAARAVILPAVLFMLHVSVMVAATSSVWWGKRHRVGNS